MVPFIPGQRLLSDRECQFPQEHQQKQNCSRASIVFPHVWFKHISPLGPKTQSCCPGSILTASIGLSNRVIDAGLVVAEAPRKSALRQVVSCCAPTESVRTEGPAAFSGAAGRFGTNDDSTLSMK